MYRTVSFKSAHIENHHIVNLYWPNKIVVDIIINFPPNVLMVIDELYYEGAFHERERERETETSVDCLLNIINWRQSINCLLNIINWSLYEIC